MIVETCPYDEDYFLRGRETGKSLYENYRWMPELTTRMVEAIIAHLGIKRKDSVLDFGCARGYVVKAFRRLGYEAFGVDISEWAIKNADEEVKPFLNWSENSPPALPEEFDWIIAKDVLEHIPEVCQAVEYLMDAAKVGVFAVVPLAHGDRYDVEEYELDVTHVHRHPLRWWVGQFHRPGRSVEGRYRVNGIKDNYAHCPTGNGFITARGIVE